MIQWPMMTGLILLTWSLPSPATGRMGPGPLSGLPWFSGSWVNGGPDRLADSEKYRGLKSDCVEQGMPGMTHWYQDAGCDSEAQVDKEFAQAPADFKPALGGVFKDTAWRSHIWPDFQLRNSHYSSPKAPQSQIGPYFIGSSGFPL